MRVHPAIFVAFLATALLGATCTDGKKLATPSPQPAPKPEARENPRPAKAADFTQVEGLDVSAVPPPMRPELWRILNETFCYCGCPRTLAACLSNRSDCGCVRCSERMTDFILDMFKLGAPAESVEYALLEGFAEGFNGREHKFDLADQPILGAADAKITLVEFADFRCGHCKHAAPVLKELVAKHPEVRLAYFYFPLGTDEDGPSVFAAEAAEEARRQGKFWAVSDALFEHQHELVDKDAVVRVAREAGVDVKAALERRAHKSQVLADKAIGMQVEVQATPTIFVNGRPFGLDRTLPNFELRVQMENERGRCD